MVFVKVRETYDLHTITNKMSIIGIHTPKADLIIKNFPGLLMQCKAYRPVSCDVTCACASMLPADPLQVSTTAGDIAPEDLFNPILYKAITNIGLSQLEARILSMDRLSTDADIKGNTALTTNENATSVSNEFNLYYGLLSNCHGWRHASPQAGFSMRGLKPLVYEMLYSVGDNPSVNDVNSTTPDDNSKFSAPSKDGIGISRYSNTFKGNGKPIPFINTTAWTTGGGGASFTGAPAIHEDFVPAPTVFCGVVIVPPSRLHQLYYRLVVEWTLEFTSIRPVGEIVSFNGLGTIGASTHYMSYDYSASKSPDVDESTLTSDSNTVSANVEVNKVM